MERFKQYLQRVSSLAKSQQLANSENPLRIVIGNTSCDMDSCVGSLILAYQLTSEAESDVYLPVINWKREAFRYQPAIAHHLIEDCKLNEDHLYFMDEFDSNYTGDQITETVLFDHNLLDVRQQHLGKNVTTIVDHHVDSNAYLDTLKSKQIKPMGSCCSILALNLQEKESFFKEDLEQGPTGQPGLAYMLGASITLDSYYFRESLKNSTWFDEDLEAHQFLSKYVDIGEEYWNRLKSIGEDIDLALSLGLRAINLSDYKIYDLKIGLMGVPLCWIPIQTLLDHFGNQEFFAQADKLMEENHLGLYTMITNVQNGTKLELLLYRPKITINELTDKYDELVSLMHDYEGWEFSDRHEGTTPDGGRFVWWDVQNKLWDRKKFENLVKERYVT